MNWEQWLMWAISTGLGVIIVPTVGWLTRGVLALKKDLVNMQLELAKLQTRYDERERDCVRHQKWNEDTQKMLNRLDKNVAVLCSKMNVEVYEKPDE